MSDGLLIREYQPSDSEACLQLEISGSELRFGGGLISAAFWHYQDFAAKARQFSAHLIFVCEDVRAGSAICGVIAVAIKQLWAHGEEVLCGYVFDLRVDSAYRKRGIGSSLTVAAETGAKDLGVKYFYLTVNGSNLVAQKLYTRLGWVRASRRCLIFRPLLLPVYTSRRDASMAARRGCVRQLTKEEALNLVCAHYARRDLGLSRAEFERLFESPNLLATFAATDAPAASDQSPGCSTAALVLWNGSTLTGFKAVRFFLPIDVWTKLSPLAPAAFALVITSALGILWAGAAQTFLSKFACIGTVLSAVTSLIGYEWARSRTAFRARIFAPVAEGPAWEPLMRVVYEAAYSEARARGFATIVINIDEDSPVASALVGHRKKSSDSVLDAPPAFWQKRIGDGDPSSRLGPLGADSFFDPRDI